MNDLAIKTQDTAHDYELICDWRGSAGKNETTLHQLSPYIGKTKSTMAASLVSQITKEGDIVYDPFSGSGTFALEAWFAGRRVVANDLNPYASLLTRAKLFPFANSNEALEMLESLSEAAEATVKAVDLRKVPKWVRAFFHPETLRETLGWMKVLRRRRLYFLEACLLGILHHQRPGFLSYPSSHSVPYLRTKKFPLKEFPDLYEYRSVRDRLEAKVKRAFRRVPDLDFGISRSCYSRKAEALVPPERVDVIITSPPYMRQLDYARDNRLRLWFIGSNSWHSLDKRVSPGEREFLNLMRRCFSVWKSVLKPGGLCVLVVGDTCSRVNRTELPSAVSSIALKDVGGYSLVCEYSEAIPNERRVRRGIIGSTSETILVLRTVGSGAK